MPASKPLLPLPRQGATVADPQPAALHQPLVQAVMSYWACGPTPTPKSPAPLPLQGATVADPQPASVHQLLEFHSRPYLQALAAYDRLSERQRGQCGLEDDCAPFPG